MIQNPILRGFYPDPSICRAGDDYYLATSSFSYFPGIPVFHSRDLCGWEQIGHVLERPEQLHVTYQDISLGIFAPTIRCHAGVFYVITTNTTTHENFVCTAENPAGPWSNPVVIAGAAGIDPSLFFDDDGKVYFTGTAGGFGDTRYDHQVIELRELDPKTMQFVGEGRVIGDGALKGAHAPEGPHLYKHNGWYYLMIAEGGTEHFHAVTVSRSRSLTEPFENYAGNPILTHRHLGREYPICNVGHADMTELPDGSWYMVCLGSRLVEGYHKPLGRETFLLPVAWEDDWPVASPGTGKVEWSYPAPACLVPSGRDASGEDADWADESEDRAETDDFTGENLGLCWNYLGTPYEKFVRVENSRLYIRMKAKGMAPTEYEGQKFEFFPRIQAAGDTRESMPFVGRRIAEPRFFAEAVMEAEPKETQSAGLIVLQNNANAIRFEAVAGKEDKTVTFRAVRVEYRLLEGDIQHFEETVCGSVDVPRAADYVLRVRADGLRYAFAVAADGKEYPVAADVDASHLGSETAGGFVGAYLGMFASGGGTEYEDEAAFDYVTLRCVRSSRRARVV